VIGLGNTFQQRKISHINPSDFNKYFTLRDIQRTSREWQENCKKWIKTYLDYVTWRNDEDKTLLYCKKVKETSSITYYRKQVYQIRRFLEYLKIDWASTIKLTLEPEYLPKRISSELIDIILGNFNDHKYVKQIKALILLGCSSGMGAEELYQLSPNDIDLDQRIIHINHSPQNK